MVKTAFPRFDTTLECNGRTDRQTDVRTDGFAVAYTALAKLALRTAVKTQMKRVTHADLLHIFVETCIGNRMKTRKNKRSSGDEIPERDVTYHPI